MQCIYKEHELYINGFNKKKVHPCLKLGKDCNGVLRGVITMK